MSSQLKNEGLVKSILGNSNCFYSFSRYRCGLFAGCKKSGGAEEAAQDNSEKHITLFNVKSEVNTQIEELAAAYTAETGVEVTVLSVQAGVDASATIKGYYLSNARYHSLRGFWLW